MDAVQVTVRFPPDEHARLLEHRESKGIITNTFIRKATEEALDRAGVPRIVKVRRRKPAKSA